MGYRVLSRNIIFEPFASDMENKFRRLHESNAESQAEATVKALERILQEAQVDDAFTQKCMRDCGETAARPARVAVVGTSNAGKTALANALLGQLLASSDSVPNTVLPVEYVLTEEPYYCLDVGGKGLKELVSKSLELPPLGTGTTRATTFQALKVINDEVRRSLHAMQDLAELSAYDSTAEHLQTWHVRISVPRDKHVSFLTDFVLIDCPGGSEKADADEDLISSTEGLCVGVAIREMLRWQIERSTMVICATRTEKMESLRKRYEAHALFGGQPPLRRRGAFVVNAIDDEDSKCSAEKYLADNPSILRNLDPLQITDRVFFVSARTMLSFRLCSKVFPPPIVDADVHGSKNPYEEVWENIELVDEMKHICQNVNMPPKLTRTVLSGAQLRAVVDAQYNQDFSNNAALHEFFAFHLSDEWPQILSESLVNRVLQHLADQKKTLAYQLELQKLPTDELKQKAGNLQKQIDDQPGMMEIIMSELKAKLPLHSQVTNACDWLSKKDFGAVPPQHGFWQNPAPQALAIAAAYKENASWGNRHAASGEMRVTFKTKQRLEDFLAEFQRWIARTVAAVFGDGDEGEVRLPAVVVPPGDAASAAKGFQIYACGHELTLDFWTIVASDTTGVVLDRIAEPKLHKQIAECKQTLQDLQAQLDGRLPMEAALVEEISRVVQAEARIKTYNKSDRLEKTRIE